MNLWDETMLATLERSRVCKCDKFELFIRGDGDRSYLAMSNGINEVLVELLTLYTKSDDQPYSDNLDEILTAIPKLYHELFGYGYF